MTGFRYEWQVSKEELAQAVSEITRPSMLKHILKTKWSSKDRKVCYYGRLNRKMSDLTAFLDRLSGDALKQRYIPGTAVMKLLHEDKRLLEIPDEVAVFERGPTESCVLNYILHALAPIVWYHEEEPFLPVDAEEFRFWAPICWWDGRRERVQRYGLDHICWVAIEDGTRPVRLSDYSHPNARIPGGQGFFLRPKWNTATTSERPYWDRTEKFRETGQVEGIPCYIDIEPTSLGLLLRYWFFHCHNEWRYKSFQHQGDWEHIEVYIAAPFSSKWLEIVPYDVAYFHHFFDPTHVKFEDCETEGMRPIVYSGLRSHASYPKPGTKVTGRYSRFTGIVDSTGRGIKWDTHRFALRPVWREKWAHFGGAWGEFRRHYGTQRYHTGPSGPLFKRYVSPTIARTRLQAATVQLWVPIPRRNNLDPWKHRERSYFADIVHLWWIPDDINDSPLDLPQIEWYTELSHDFHKISSVNPCSFNPPAKDEFDGEICRLQGGANDKVTDHVIQTVNRYSIRKTTLQAPDSENLKNVRKLKSFPLQAWTQTRLLRARFDGLRLFYFRTKIRYKCELYGTVIAFTAVIPGVFQFERSMRYKMPDNYKFRYVLNDHKGTIHDLQCGIPKHLRKIRRMQTLVSLPVYADMREFDPSGVQPSISFFKMLLRKNQSAVGNLSTNIDIVKSSIMHKYLYSQDPLKRTPLANLNLCRTCF